jgi:tripartite-type tricarboxylate transporter receptor subunit TctC
MLTKRTFLPALAWAGAALPALAQSLIQRPIKMVVPGGPGGLNDVFARLIAHSLGSTAGLTVIIENNGAAGGMLAARSVARADPDGHTLLLGNTSVFAVIPAAAKNPGYDPTKDFSAVAKVADGFQVLVVAPDFPAKLVAELISYAKAHPGELNVAAVHGTIPHLAAELLKLRAGINLVHVPYKTESEMIAAVISGQVHLSFVNVATILPLIADGKVRALGVTTATRQPELADVPTMIEGGLSDYVVTSFFGVAAPAGTPPRIVEHLNSAINQSLRSPDVQAGLLKAGVRPAGGTPKEFEAFVRTEMEKWSAVVKAAGFTMD